MEFQGIKRLLATTCLAFSMSANAGIITGTVNAYDIDTFSFSVTSTGMTTFDILAGSFNSGVSGQGLDDSMFRIATDDGSLDASDFLFYDDDGGLGFDGSTSGLDSYLSTNMTAGNYIFFIGAYRLDISEILNDSFSTPNASNAGDYQLTFSDNVSMNAPAIVAEPSSIALFGLGLLGLGVARARKAS